jgi:hypothetical protein
MDALRARSLGVQSVEQLYRWLTEISARTPEAVHDSASRSFFSARGLSRVAYSFVAPSTLARLRLKVPRGR